MLWTLGKLIFLAFWGVIASMALQLHLVHIPLGWAPWLMTSFWVLLGIHLVGWLWTRIAFRFAPSALLPGFVEVMLFGLVSILPKWNAYMEALNNREYLDAMHPRTMPFSLKLGQMLLQGLFGLAAYFKKERPTHSRGIAATGYACIEPPADFPAHDFFEKGKVYPVVLRHADLSYDDSRRRDIRGAALRFGGFEDNGLFDMMMNTGTTSAFWNLPSFFSFIRNGAQYPGLQRYTDAYPLAMPAALGGLHWGPTSYTSLGYYSQLVYRFVGKDGTLRFIRYRLVPGDKPEDNSALSQTLPWNNAVLPQDKRDPDYLRQEFATRLSNGSIPYRFQAQIREAGDDPELCHSGKSWDDVPWVELAKITIDVLLSEEETQHLQYNIGNHPRSLGLLPARGWRDYNALAQLRVAVYRFSSSMRTRRSRKRLPRWDFELGALVPRVRKLDGNTPQPHPKIRKNAFYAPNLMGFLFMHKLNRALGKFGLLNAKQMQRLHPENRTIQMERNETGSSRCDEAFGDRILNGFYPVPLYQNNGDAELFTAKFCWDAERFDGKLGLTNSLVQLRRHGEQLIPEQIHIQFREEGDLGPTPRLEPDEIVTPYDGSRWELAKQLVQHSLCLEGQALGHFVECHINMEQYAVAAHRRLYNHPLSSLLLPHLKGVVEINSAGSGVIFGESGILCVNSALTAESSASLFARHLGGLHWAGWAPRPRICVTDRYGGISNLYWTIIREHVSSFIDANRDEIDKKWSDVYAFSQDLVLYSVPHDKHTHSNGSQRIGASKVSPFVEIHGVTKAVPPVTLRVHSPSDEDWQNLIQVCSYILFHSTLFHTWTNDTMHESLGELAYMNFGIEEQRLREVWRKGESTTLLPPPVPAAYQLFLVNFLVKLRCGFVMANEFRDIPMNFIRNLEKHRLQFAELGMNIDNIRSCINI